MPLVEGPSLWARTSCWWTTASSGAPRAWSWCRWPGMPAPERCVSLSLPLSLPSSLRGCGCSDGCFFFFLSRCLCRYCHGPLRRGRFPLAAQSSPSFLLNTHTKYVIVVVVSSCQARSRPWLGAPVTVTCFSLFASFLPFLSLSYPFLTPCHAMPCRAMPCHAVPCRTLALCADHMI